jgi:hypothetical protein
MSRALVGAYAIPIGAGIVGARFVALYLMRVKSELSNPRITRLR